MLAFTLSLRAPVAVPRSLNQASGLAERLQRLDAGTLAAYVYQTLTRPVRVSSRYSI
jgi:hypothetical protein